MHVYSIDELRGLPQPPQLLTPAELEQPCGLPRRNPLTGADAILGGMMDAMNASLLDACPRESSIFEKVAVVDFAQWIHCQELVKRLYKIVIKVWPDAKLEEMKITIVVPSLRQLEEIKQRKAS